MLRLCSYSLWILDICKSDIKVVAHGKRLYTEKREKFRQLLKQLRIDAGLTQQTLARKLNRHQSYVSDYERGHRRLDWVAIDEIVAACGQDLVRLAGRYSKAVAAL